MQIEILTKNQIKKEVAKQVETKEYKMQRFIDMLQRRVLRLEEEMLVKNSKMYPKEKPIKSDLFPKRKWTKKEYSK